MIFYFFCAIEGGEKRNGLLKHTPLHEFFFYPLSLSLRFCFYDGLGLMRRMFFFFSTGGFCSNLSTCLSLSFGVLSISVCCYISSPHLSGLIRVSDLSDAVES